MKLTFLRALGSFALAGAMTLSCAAGDDAAAVDDSDLSVSSRCAREEKPKIDHLLDVAKADLARLDTEYARTLRAEMDAGRLSILPFCAMNKSEFRELRKYADFSSLAADGKRPTVPELYDDLHGAKPEMVQLVNDQFFGFQWTKRVFFSATQRRSVFLETLAHEARHVLREAHKRDYEDPSILCEEELAAYEAEILVRREKVTDTERAHIHANMRSLFDLSALRANSCAKK